MPHEFIATATGGPHGFSLPATSVAEHPEFAEGRFSAYVVAPGRLLVCADRMTADDDDPVVASYLALLDQEMRRHPQRIPALTRADVEGLDELLSRVEVQRDQTLDDFTLP